MKIRAKHQTAGFWVLAISTIIPFHCLATGGGTLAGSVLDNTGRPVAGAHVLINHAPSIAAAHLSAPPTITGPLAATVVASSQGTFSVGALSPGEYIVCAEVSTPGLLDPCHWAASAPTATVAAGETTSGVTVTMAAGAVVPIHISDPLAMLTPVSGSQMSFDLQVHAVTSKGLHYIAETQASSAVSRDLAITIPFGAAITLQVRSLHLIVNDQTGNPVPSAGAGISVAAGAVPSAVTYVIAGSK